MKWVKDNIESFGGDPNNITLAGASAGAHAVSGKNYLLCLMSHDQYQKYWFQKVHLTHSEGSEYYNNAIVMSTTQLAFWPQADAEAGYKQIAVDMLGCSSHAG